MKSRSKEKHETENRLTRTLGSRFYLVEVLDLVVYDNSNSEKVRLICGKGFNQCKGGFNGSKGRKMAKGGRNPRRG